MKPILQTISNTGTDRGYSFWTQWLDCTKKAALSQENPQARGLSGKEPIDVGVVTHALLERWYKRAMKEGGDAADCMDTAVIKWTDPTEFPASYKERVYQEADRLFQAWRRHHDPLEYGRPFSVEKKYTVTDFYNWDRFTIRPDIVFDVTDAAAKASNLPRGGLYSADFKTWGREGSFDLLYSLSDLRFHCYMEAFVRADQSHADRYRGNIVMAIHRGREPVFRRYFLKYEDYNGDRVKALTTQTAKARERALKGDHTIDNRHCVHYTRFEKCRFFGKECPGY
jgi:hypothetical protein